MAGKYYVNPEKGHLTTEYGRFEKNSELPETVQLMGTVFDQETQQDVPGFIRGPIPEGLIKQWLKDGNILEKQPATDKKPKPKE